jgi:ParB family transcriptional regulator, chromosome partitioning protein
MRSVVMVDPFRCRMWHLHDRLEEYISEETCKAEIESFNKHGQLIPALGRRLTRDEHYEVELICGARRLFIAKYTRKPLRVEICDLSDKEAIVAMDMENRQRQDVSPYERGLSYARWLRAGYFESQDELAQSLSVSASQVSRLLKLARLPAVIVDAFANTVEICEGWGLSLTELLEDPVSRRCILKKAREIAAASPRPAAREVYRRLLAAAAPGLKPKLLTRDEVIKSDIGEPLFRVRQQRDSIVLILPMEKIGSKALDSIKLSVADIMQTPVPTRRASLADHPPGELAGCNLVSA